jgi:hypothetical protein
MAGRALLAYPLQIQNANVGGLYVGSVSVVVEDIWGNSYTAYANCPTALVPGTGAPGAAPGTLQCNWQLRTP